MEIQIKHFIFLYFYQQIKWSVPACSKAPQNKSSNIKDKMAMILFFFICIKSSGKV